MKPKKHILVLTLIALMSPAAHADTTSLRVAPIHFIHLNSASGKFLNVFFVVANTPAIGGLRGQQLEFSEIRLAPIRVQIPANGEVEIPETLVPRSDTAFGPAKTYSHIFIALTGAQPNPLYLRNTNGALVGASPSPVLDPRIGPDQLKRLPDSSFQILSSGFISKFGLPAHLRNGVIYLDALTDLGQGEDD